MPLRDRLLPLLTALSLLPFAAATEPAAPAKNPDSACSVIKLAFANGFRLTLPRKLCVSRTAGPGHWVYTFSKGAGQRPFLTMYAGSDAGFAYDIETPEETVWRREGHTTCGVMHLEKKSVAGLVHVRGVGHYGASLQCREVLVRRAEMVKGEIDARALHFWFESTSPEVIALAESVVALVTPGPTLDAEPPIEGDAPSRP